MQHRKEIDGLRALAVLPVIFFHAGIPQFSGGYVGVDVFFVISGYLITNLLISEVSSTGSISILNFYERRARRLLPALFFMLAGVSLVAAVILPPGQLIEYGWNAVASAVFVSNVSLWMQGGYFGGPAETNALMHTWSLAIEEQFYILFPPLLLLAWRLRGQRGVAEFTLLVIVLSLAISELGTRFASTANYFLLPSRAWELAIGALTALVFRESTLQYPTKVRDLVAFAGLAMIFVAVFTFSEATPFPSLWALLPTVGTAMILITATPETWAGRVLTLPIFLFFGLISYSLYLWHQPVLALYRVQFGDAASPVGIAIAVAMSILIAWFSWRFVEKPFRNRAFLSRQKIFLGTAVGMALIAACGGLFIFSRGLIQRFPENLHESVGASASELGDYTRLAYNEEIRDKPFAGQQPRLLIIGDSFSQDLYNIVRESHAFPGYQISADYIAARCQFRIQGSEPKGAINGADARRCVIEDNNINAGTRERIQQADVILLAFFWQDWAVTQLPETLKSLNLLDSTKLVVMGSKRFPSPSPSKMARMSMKDLADFRFPLEVQTAEVNQKLAGLKMAGRFVDPMQLLCSGPNACRYFTPEGKPVSYDGRHLTRAGARYLGELLFGAGGPLETYANASRR